MLFKVKVDAVDIAGSHHAAGIEERRRVERSDDPGYSPGETPQLVGKKSRNSAAPMQNIREPSRAEPLAGVSIDRVIEQVERRYKAKVVNQKEKRSGDRKIYELRLLSDEGRVWTVRVDAETGKEI